MTPTTALLVEDEPLVALVAAESLTALGFDVEIAGTAADALTAAERGLGDAALALVDVGLPDAKGDVLARRLKLRFPNLNLVLASGYDAQELRGRMGDIRVPVMTKPYGENSLRTTLAGLGYVLPAD